MHTHALFDTLAHTDTLPDLKPLSCYFEKYNTTKQACFSAGEKPKKKRYPSNAVNRRPKQTEVVMKKLCELLLTNILMRKTPRRCNSPPLSPPECPPHPKKWSLPTKVTCTNSDPQSIILTYCICTYCIYYTYLIHIYSYINFSYRHTIFLFLLLFVVRCWLHFQQEALT